MPHANRKQPREMGMLGGPAGATALLGAGVLLGILWERRRSRRPSGPAAVRPPEVSEIPRVSNATDATTAIRAHGVCIMERALDSAAVRELSERIEAVEPRKRQNRRAHRWEHVHSPEAPPLAELAAMPLLVEVVRSLLGPKYYLEKAGVVVSHHGAEEQRWHMDTPHLFSTGAHLPPHSLSVFVPLCELVLDNGPTEYQLGTHLRANLVAKQRRAIASCPAGSLVLYDPRTMHRGGPNTSHADRPLVYLTFSRIWCARAATGVPARTWAFVRSVRIAAGHHCHPRLLDSQVPGYSQPVSVR